MLAYDSTGSFHNPHATIAKRPNVKWQASIATHRGYLFFGNDRLYIDHGGGLSIVNVGEQSVISGQISVQLLTVWDDVLYFSGSSEGADQQVTFALKADEWLKRSFSAGSGDYGTPTSSPDVTDPLWHHDQRVVRGKRVGGIFFGLTDSGTFLAVDAKTGKEQWASNLSFQARDFAVTESNIILYNEEEIRSLDTVTGKEQWQQRPDPEQLLESIELDSSTEEIIDSPSDVSLRFGSVGMTGGNLFVSESDPQLGIRVVSRRNPTTGEATWFQQDAGVRGTTEELFFTAFGAWDSRTGDSLWHVGSNPSFVPSPGLPTIATREHILIAGGHPDDPQQKSRLVAFQQSDGSRSWALDVEERIWTFIAVKDTIYATAPAGTVLAIS